MKIYTKTGDEGTTGLLGGRRVPKSDNRVKAYGNVDEINSIIGIILANQLDDGIRNLLLKIQNELFIAGSDLSNPNTNDASNRVNITMVEFLEKKIDELENELTPTSNFILPGGTKIASLIHFARTVVRRSETQIITLSESEKINDDCKKYFNRLSDLLFVLARVVNKRSGVSDVIWEPAKDTL